jgi:hypothetical protein
LIGVTLGCRSKKLVSWTRPPGLNISRTSKVIPLKFIDCTDALWRPDIQQVKYNQTGQRNVRYKSNFKRELVDELVNLCTEMIPYCTIRYAF